MRYGLLRGPNFGDEDLENIGVSQDMIINSSETQDISKKKNIFCGIVSFIFFITFVVGLSVLDYKETTAYFKPLYSMEDAQGLAYLYSIESDQTPIYSEISPKQIELLFQGYLSKYEKSFENLSDKKKRFEIFKKQLSAIDKNNQANIAAGGEIIHGLNKFSDISAEDFKQIFLNAAPKNIDLEVKSAKIIPYTGDLSSMDWSGKYTTPVTDQGFCGACWAFSSMNQVESDSIRQGLLKVTDHLSAEQLISCAKQSLGCHGGWTEVGFDYMERFGISLFSDYPYSDFWQPDTASTCYADQTFSVVRVTDVFKVQTEDDMISHVLSVGPLSVCLDATEWQTYFGGVLKTCGKSPNHCVQVVGVNKEEGYWKIRNNWGSDWGEEGYIRLALGSDMCAISSDARFTDVAKVIHDTVVIKNLKVWNIKRPMSLDKPDPYIVFTLGSQSYTTIVMKNTDNITWPEQFEINWDGISDLKLIMYDSNWFFYDDSLGSLSLSLLSDSFQDYSFVKVEQSFDDSKAIVSFDIMLNPRSSRPNGEVAAVSATVSPLVTSNIPAKIVSSDKKAATSSTAVKTNSSFTQAK